MNCDDYGPKEWVAEEALGLEFYGPGGYGAQFRLDWHEEGEPMGGEG